MPQITPMNVTGPATPQPQTLASAVDTTKVSPETATQAVEAQVEEAKSVDPLSPKFAALARQQKMIRQQQIEFQEQKKAFEAERQQIEQAKSWKQRLTQDPYSVMLEAGLTADQVAALMLQQPNVEDQKFSQVQSELKAIKEAQEQAKQEAQRVQQQQYDNAVTQIRNDVENLVMADESYETIKTMGASEAVVALIEENFHKTGRLLSIEDAAKDVEEYLVEEAMKIASINKIKSRFIPAPEQPQVPQKQGIQAQLQKQQEQQTLKTLSNKSLAGQSHATTAKEKRERAILAFQGKLT